MNNLELVNEWIMEILPKDSDSYIEITRRDNICSEIEFRLITDKNIYTICAHKCINKEGSNDYLGCVISSRDGSGIKSLSEGLISRETWEGIKDSIIRSEVIMKCQVDPAELGG